MNASLRHVKYQVSKSMVKVRSTITRHPRKSLLFLAVTLALVGSVAGYVVYVNTTANSYINTSEAFAEDVYNYGGKDAVVIAKKFSKTPRLTKLPAGAFFSSTYKEAETIDSLLQKYKSVADGINARIAISSTDQFHKKLSTLANNYRAKESTIIKEQTKKETTDTAQSNSNLLSKLVEIRTETLTRIEQNHQSHLKEANALEVPSGLNDVKNYYIELIQRDKDLAGEYKTMYKNAKTLGAIDRLNASYQREQQKISDETVIAVYSAYALQKDQFTLALSIQYGLKENLLALSKDSYNDAELKAMTALYTRYARYSVTKNILSNNDTANFGHAYFGLYMVQKQLNEATTPNKELVDLLRKKASDIRNASDLALFGQQRDGNITQNEDQIIDTIKSITEINDLSGFSVTARQVGSEEKAKGAVIEIPETRKYYENLFATMLPESELTKNELKSFQTSAKKCVDASLRFYEISKKNFAELNNIDDERRKLIKELTKAKTEDKDISGTQERYNALQGRVAQVDAIRIPAAATYKNEFDTCTKEIESSQSILSKKLKDEMPFRTAFYDKSVALNDAIKNNTLR